MTAKARYLRKAAIAHLLRAAAGVTGRDSFVLVGTGAVVAQLTAVPLDLMRTREIDLYVPDNVALSKLCAWRDKDRDWLRAGLGSGVLRLGAMRARAGRISNPNAPDRAEIERRLASLG